LQRKSLAITVGTGDHTGDHTSCCITLQHLLAPLLVTVPGISIEASTERWACLHLGVQPCFALTPLALGAALPPRQGNREDGQVVDAPTTWRKHCTLTRSRCRLLASVLDFCATRVSWPCRSK